MSADWERGLRKISGKARGERYEWKASDQFLKTCLSWLKLKKVGKKPAAKKA
jgi:hypothetical protein